MNPEQSGCTKMDSPRCATHFIRLGSRAAVVTRSALGFGVPGGDSTEPEPPVSEIVCFTPVPFAPMQVIRSLDTVSRTFPSISTKATKLTSLVFALH